MVLMNTSTYIQFRCTCTSAYLFSPDGVKAYSVQGGSRECHVHIHKKHQVAVLALASTEFQGQGTSKAGVGLRVDLVVNVV